ncbi:hypothetical protein CAPTEDRAFT_159631 [Capitella teleta]|uniref:Uncharacterized protein n=1 Tax=Capitella teleta TaxID=283909 RepID=R7UD87_CAPTE|nr:hypothetical protein CAPTEDRAFT_159631 [Capitella teleta]|eukprot:ELU04066.1 hypothetical protein CAPTEDRAFT_159631 [Capitella teleta]
MGNVNEFFAMFLVPEEEGVDPLDLREVHQVIKELTYGIYVLNQVPTIALEANFDQSTSVQIPPAYMDTRVGQIMTNIDYMMKALWHGAYFPREKRTKFSERWRGNLDVNASGKPETKKTLLTEFTTAGLLDISKDPDFSTAFDKLPVDEPGDSDIANECRYFMSHVEELSMQMTVFQNSVHQHENLFLVDSDWLISSIVRVLEDKIDNAGYERLNARLQLHEIMLNEHLPKKAEIKKQLHLLKLIGFLVPFLVGMKKKMRIPDIKKMLPNMTGEVLKVERELPPLILSQDFKCKNFNFGNHYFHLHGGILIDNETPDVTPMPEEIAKQYDNIKFETLGFLSKNCEPGGTLHESYPLPVMQIAGKRYISMALEFETYYPQTPQKPKWVNCMWEEVTKLRPKRLPLSDTEIYEQFRKLFGYKRAIKYKNLPNGLKAAAQRGLVSMFATLCRKCQASRLGKQDEMGLSLIHHAAIWNRPQIIAVLILQSMDVNVRRNNNILSTGTHRLQLCQVRSGPTALHLAARCGSLDAASCLIANYANLMAVDQDGWAPIHHAAFYDHEQIVRLMIRKNEAMMELQTKNEYKSTPLLLAASSGALVCLKCLIDSGAQVLCTNAEGNNVIHLAAMRFHTNVLEFFIQWEHPEVPVWTLLVGMLRENQDAKKDAAVKCLEVMSTSNNNHWQQILSAGGVPALVDILRQDNTALQSVAASVLCNISEHEAVRKALTLTKACPILIQLLQSPVDEIQSRAAIVLSDLACVDDNQDTIAVEGGIPALVNLLDSELEDVLVNAVNAIRVMCIGNTANQSAVAEHGGIDPLVEFLTINSDILQAAASAAIAAVTAGHKGNQDLVIAEGAVKPIVTLIKGHNLTVQVKAAEALEALVDMNSSAQKAFLDLDAPKSLMRVLKMFSMEVKEQAACALWALAGQTKAQQKHIAERIGIQQLCEILLRDSERLQYVGCLGMMALGREDLESQNRIANGGGIPPLVRLLRQPKTSERVLLSVIQALGTLCVGIAHNSNKVMQAKISEEQGISLLVQLMLAPPSVDIQVEVAYTLGCVVLSNRENQEKLRQHAHFKFDTLLDLLESKDETLRLKAGQALTIFAFNNTPQQFAIREAGGIHFSCFAEFLDSNEEYYRSYAAFQVVVLARVIVDQDQVSLTARGVTTLVKVLDAEDDDSVILAASLMSSLAHTRAGIPDAMTTVGAIDMLIKKLYVSNEQVRGAVAISLGYLSFNRTAARLLLVACRNTPGLYELLIANIGTNPKISRDFTEEFRRCQLVGLPCLSLEVNGGPPAIPPRRLPSRPKTSHPSRRFRNRDDDRSLSAPAAVHRARSAGPSRMKSVQTPDNASSFKSSKVSLIETPHSSAFNRRDTCMKTSVTAWEKK